MSGEGEIIVQMRWLRSEGKDADACICCEGPHVYAYLPDVVSSDYPWKYNIMNDFVGHAHRAFTRFPEGAKVRVRFEQVEE